MINWLKKTYQKFFDGMISKMKVSWGKVHDYLGMQLDFETAGEVKITMIDYVKDILEEFKKHDPSFKTTNMPAVDHLFKIWDKLMPLLEV